MTSVHGVRSNLQFQNEDFDTIVNKPHSCSPSSIYIIIISKKYFLHFPFCLVYRVYFWPTVFAKFSFSLYISFFLSLSLFLPLSLFLEAWLVDFDVSPHTAIVISQSCFQPKKKYFDISAQIKIPVSGSCKATQRRMSKAVNNVSSSSSNVDLNVSCLREDKEIFKYDRFDQNRREQFKTFKAQWGSLKTTLNISFDAQIFKTDPLLVLYFQLFNSVRIDAIKFANVWSADLWCRKQPLYPLYRSPRN